MVEPVRARLELLTELADDDLDPVVTVALSTFVTGRSNPAPSTWVGTVVDVVVGTVATAGAADVVGVAVVEVTMVVVDSS